MEERTTSKVIIKTAAITTAALLLACVIIAVFVFFCFPFAGYKFTDNLEMKKSALFFAERYERDGNIDGLVYCIELDEALIAAKDDAKYFNKLMEHTEKFFKYEKCFEYFEQIDAYYISENDFPISHISLYSYYEYIVRRNFAARVQLGQADSMIFRGEVKALSDIFPQDITTMEEAIIYSAIGGAIQDQKTLLFVDGKFTDLYAKLKGSVPGYVYSLDHDDRDDTLETLFLLHNVLQLINEVNELGLPDPDWQAYKKFTYKGEALDEAYKKLFLEYIHSIERR